MKRLLPIVVVYLLAACATTSPTQELGGTNRSEETQTQRLARIHTELGAGYYARHQQNVALEELNEALKVDAKYAPAHSILGLVYMELKEDAKAEQSFRLAIDLAPQDPEIRNNYGWFLCHRSQFKPAIEQFNIAAKHPLYRTPEVALVNAGLCSARLGEINEARQYFRRALAIQPAQPTAYFGLAEIAYKSAQFEEAREHMKGVMQAANPPPQALLLGACIERKLGDRTSELSYSQQLRNRYPESREMKQLQGGWCE